MNRVARLFSSWGVNVAIALTALRTNLMRSILTTLGVMIGVLAVILAVAVGEGAKSSVVEFDQFAGIEHGAYISAAGK